MATATKVRQSEKLIAEQSKKVDRPELELPVLEKTQGVFEIAPIICRNSFVILYPFSMESTLELPAEMEYRNVGIVVGKSNSILTPHGERVPSQLDYGTVVLFQKRSVIGDIFINAAPYIGKRLVILSELNIVCELPPVPFRVTNKAISHNAFGDRRPDAQKEAD